MRYGRNFRSRGFRRRYPKRRFKFIDPFAQEYPYNEYIKYEQLRVIDEDGNNLGIMPRVQALQIAKDKDLDLVVIARNANPPVAKILNLEHFRYEQQKKQKQLRKKQREHKPKEVKFKPLIGDGDYQRKLKQIQEFLEDGYIVKVTIIKKRRVSKEVQQALKDRLLTDLKLYSNIVDIQDKGNNIHILVKALKNNGKQNTKNPEKTVQTDQE